MMRAVDEQQMEIVLTWLEEEGNCGPSRGFPRVRGWPMVGELVANVLDFSVYHPRIPRNECIIQ